MKCSGFCTRVQWFGLKGVTYWSWRGLFEPNPYQTHTYDVFCWTQIHPIGFHTKYCVKTLIILLKRTGRPSALLFRIYVTIPNFSRSLSRETCPNNAGTRSIYNVDLKAHILPVFALILMSRDRSRWLVVPFADVILMVTTTLLLPHWFEAQHAHKLWSRFLIQVFKCFPGLSVNGRSS